MIPSNREGRDEASRDPVVEEAFRILMRHTQAPQGFYARIMARIAAESPTLRDRLVRWLSPLWQPQWVGELVTAADIPEQEHVFRLEDGEIKISCSWRSQYNENPAYVWVSWWADISTPGELWVRFARPETETVLAEICLGTHLEGEKVFTNDDLGFDPSREKWAISLILRGVES